MKSIHIPITGGPPMNIELSTGESMYILGANGSGKSSLMHKFFVSSPSTAHRITGHRLTWLQSEDVLLTQPEHQIEESRLKSDSQITAIWKDDSWHTRNALTVTRLISSENNSNRSIADALKSGDKQLAYENAEKKSALDIVNDCFKYSNIRITLSLNSTNQLQACKTGGPSYPIARLSDGERNALFLIADVLSVPKGTLLLVDEPEKHLHRSIITPLLSYLFSLRKDCYHIVSTHEVQLAVEAKSTKSLLVRACSHGSSTVQSWTADLVESEDGIDESIKNNILGSRRKIIFVEGGETSLDKLLYSIIFPDVSIVPKSGCVSVEKAVSGIRNTSNMNWIQAFGIVDNDRKSSVEIDALKERGVFALPVHTVESIYYQPQIQKMIAERFSVYSGADPIEQQQKSDTDFLKAISPHIKRLSQRVSEHAIRDLVDFKKPTQEQIQSGGIISVEINIDTIVEDEFQKLKSLIDSSRVDNIISRYPVRTTPGLDRIAIALGFQGRVEYENAARMLIKDDEDALNLVRGYFGDLISQLSTD